MASILFLLLISLSTIHTAPSDFHDLAGLGSRISAQVNSELAPLNGLGERINKQVQESIAPVQKDLAGLGDHIAKQVYEELEPVRALEIIDRMKWGVGGVTVVTHSPSGRKFIHKDYTKLICSGTINDETGDCTDGKLEPFAITESSPRSDYCFMSVQIRVNNKICIGDGGLVINSFGTFGGDFDNILCSNTIPGRPSLVLSIDDYKKLCAPVSATVEYRYFSNFKDPNHVEIPNKNKNVKCENDKENVCIFNEKNDKLVLHSNYSHQVMYYY